LPLHCDGCCNVANGDHIRRRIERLELATRFRPVHIAVLLLTAAPPPRFDDYFYLPSGAHSHRSAYWRAFFEETAAIAGISRAAAAGEESALSEFQRQGFFLAHCCECPLSEPGGADILAAGGADGKEIATRYGRSTTLRIRHSYKPKHIVPIGFGTTEIVVALAQEGLEELLVLDAGAPFLDPFPGDPSASLNSRASLAPRIRKALGFSA
jgi:hypothetical protein